MHLASFIEALERTGWNNKRYAEENQRVRDLYDIAYASLVKIGKILRYIEILLPLCSSNTYVRPSDAVRSRDRDPGIGDISAI